MVSIANIKTQRKITSTKQFCNPLRATTLFLGTGDKKNSGNIDIEDFIGTRHVKMKTLHRRKLIQNNKCDTCDTCDTCYTCDKCDKYKIRKSGNRKIRK